MTFVPGRGRASQQAWDSSVRTTNEGDPAMKIIVIVILAAVGVILLAGSRDIRRFQRMRRM